MQATVTERAIDPLLFDWPSEAPALKCSRCCQCGERAFPVNTSCMACGCEEVFIERLPLRGRLWTYTVQTFMPKSPYHSDETPETFQPFAVGYIELENVLRIESRIPLREGTDLQLGMEMVLGFYKHRTEDDGTLLVNYEFTPA